MRTTTQRLAIQGTVLLGAMLGLSLLGGWARSADADSDPPPLAESALLGEIRALRREVEAREGELDVMRVQLERANAVIDYSGRYRVPADLAGTIYDVALSEGLAPHIAFPLVQLESRFDGRARSRAGAIGLAQVLPSTARLYEPGLTDTALYQPEINLRIGFRYLRDLMERYDGDLERALLAYNRGPARVQELLDAGRNPRNGYAERIMRERSR
jgi:soluble lytic murein transglycosylase-like protein